MSPIFSALCLGLKWLQKKKKIIQSLDLLYELGVRDLGLFVAKQPDYCKCTIVLGQFYNPLHMNRSEIKKEQERF